MLDVIHYYFEEDSTYLSQESVERKSLMREHMYKTLYESVYPYTTHTTNTNSSREKINPEEFTESDGESWDDEIAKTKLFSPSTQPPAPYVPPTQFNPDAPQPFGNLLDAPLG